MKDLAPSATARFVATGVFQIATHSHLHVEVPRRMAELNERMLQASTRSDLRGGFGRRWVRWQAGLLQRFAVPGFFLHFVLRKRWIEALAREAIGRGASQIVILGAGLDTLSLRLAETNPKLTILEVDHPATQGGKKLAVESLPDRWKPPTFVALDLTQRDLRESLLACPAYDPAAPTLFIAEGLLMYLTEAEVMEIFDVVRACAGPGSATLFTFMDEQRPGNFQFRNATRLVDLWLRLKQEKFVWGIGPDQLGAFLEERGHRLKSWVGEKEFRERLLTPENRHAPLAIGEHVALAEVIR